MTREINYQKANEYWNKNLSQGEVGRFASGFVMPAELEDLAFYRFKEELYFLEKHGVFEGNYMDIGCGAGNLLCEWHSRFSNLIGIDFSESLVKIGRKQCQGFKNVNIFEDNALNFKKYIKNQKLNFIFVGGCFMYLEDKDVSYLIKNLLLTLEENGVLIFREPTASKKRIYKEKVGVRRTIEEYKGLIGLNDGGYSLKIYQNNSVNYTQIIALYFELFPFLKNKVHFFENPIIEFFTLFLPLRAYSKLKRNMALYHFFVIERTQRT
ncbi:MAG: methyltransferase domain-containing protein [Candidatus Omnitrophota bacterium]